MKANPNRGPGDWTPDDPKEISDIAWQDAIWTECERIKAFDEGVDLIELLVDSATSLNYLLAYTPASLLPFGSGEKLQRLNKKLDQLKTSVLYRSKHWGVKDGR